MCVYMYIYRRKFMLTKLCNTHVIFTCQTVCWLIVCMVCVCEHVLLFAVCVSLLFTVYSWKKLGSHYSDVFCKCFCMFLHAFYKLCICYCCFPVLIMLLYIVFYLSVTGTVAYVVSGVWYYVVSGVWYYVVSGDVSLAGVPFPTPLRCMWRLLVVCCGRCLVQCFFLPLG